MDMVRFVGEVCAMFVVCYLYVVCVLDVGIVDMGEVFVVMEFE